MRTTKWVLLLATATALTACGSGDAGKSASGAAKAASRSGSGSSRVSATAAEVAEEARGDVDCPARIKSAKRDPKAAVDDVVGVRPGMTYEEAANVVMCTHDLMVAQPDKTRGFRIQTYGQTLRQGFNARFAEPKVEKTSRDYMKEMQDNAIARGSNRATQDMQPGQSKWYVGTMGMPGEERVITAAREEWFEEGRNPTIASVEQALLKKYGAPTRNQHNNGRTNLTWAYDPFGRLITETSPLFHQCHGSADPDGGSNFSPDCGTVVAATLDPLPGNPDLARFMQVGVVDQAGGYEVLTATEQGLQGLESQRRARETEAASKNADTPQL